MLITAMLAELASEDVALAQQVSGAVGSSNCSCGCPSVWLVVDSTAQRSTRHGTVELFAHHEALQLLATLTISEGRLLELDCTSLGEMGSFPLTLESLDDWEFSVTNNDL